MKQINVLKKNIHTHVLMNHAQQQLELYVYF